MKRNAHHCRTAATKKTCPTPNSETSDVSGALFGALTILSWAGFNVAEKAGIDAGLSPAALSFPRYLPLAFLAVPLWFWLRRGSQSIAVPFARLMALAVLGGPIFELSAVDGYQFAPLSHGLLFAPVTVFLTGKIIGAMPLRERIAPTRVLSAAAMFSGLALLVRVETNGFAGQSYIGILLLVNAGVIWATILRCFATERSGTSKARRRWLAWRRVCHGGR